MDKRRIAYNILVVLALVLLVILICTITVKNTNIIESYSIDSAVRKLGYDIEIPEILYKEPNITSACILGQLIELDNEHITFRAGKGVPEEADILGEYEDWEYSETFVSNNNGNKIEYLLRGTSNSDIRLITWNKSDIYYGIKYKTGLNFDKSFSYLGINSESLEVKEVEKPMDGTNDENLTEYKNNYFKLTPPPIIGKNYTVVESESPDGILSFSFNTFLDKLGLKTIFVIYRVKSEDADKLKINDYTLPSTDNNLVLAETEDYLYTLTYLNTNPFKDGTLEYEAYYTIKNQMKAVMESFEVLNT